MKNKKIDKTRRHFFNSWKKLFRNYSLSIVLTFLFLTSWTAQFFVQVIKIENDAHARGVAFTWSEFWPEFWTSTLENWQSEFLQLLTFVVLTSFLIHKHSPESRDSEERAEKKLNQIIALLSKEKKK